jgi:hypothetical protein
MDDYHKDSQLVLPNDIFTAMEDILLVDESAAAALAFLEDVGFPETLPPFWQFRREVFLAAVKTDKGEYATEMEILVNALDE